MERTMINIRSTMILDKYRFCGEEVKTIILKLRNRKAHSLDNIVNETIKYSGYQI